MMVCTFDELVADPRDLVRRIAIWSGLDPSFYDDFAFEKENESYQPKSRALQRINVSIRAHLSKGRFYDGLRGLYRKLNTQPVRAERDDAEVLAKLAMEFSSRSVKLADEFDLRLDRWP
ncbi:hypothetical protein PAF17_14610 [Paracoccus sp. Z330]|uniref:Uncharacterized protein n=1 Tax=Paracoccus onchidii TaxID=3017813 RepID=A0ABT4ZI11_9RHOB|nr:hypothetical protein [Paracoccus onchidii]MDB6178727.1 hypothetical protein [Paracoccus onchidii]